MKYEIVPSNKFRKDLKLAEKRGYEIKKIRDVIAALADGQQLDERYRDHTLTGNYAGYRECHIQPDWLLIYRIQESELILLLSRTGTHSDLF